MPYVQMKKIIFLVKVGFNNNHNHSSGCVLRPLSQREPFIFLLPFFLIDTSEVLELNLIILQVCIVLRIRTGVLQAAAAEQLWG